MAQISLFHSITIVVLFVAIVEVTFTNPVGTDANYTWIKGETILDLASKLNNSELLWKIGNAIVNLECKTQRCTRWTNWTTCQPTIDTFGGHLGRGLVKLVMTNVLDIDQKLKNRLKSAK